MYGNMKSAKKSPPKTVQNFENKKEALAGCVCAVLLVYININNILS